MFAIVVVSAIVAMLLHCCPDLEIAGPHWIGAAIRVMVNSASLVLGVDVCMAAITCVDGTIFPPSLPTASQCPVATLAV